MSTPADEEPLYSQRRIDVTDEDTLNRAREIAQARGEEPDAFNEADLKQAEWELSDAKQLNPEGVEAPKTVPVSRDPSDPVMSMGEDAQKHEQPDEQRFMEKQVKKGADDALLDEMAEGHSTES